MEVTANVGQQLPYAMETGKKISRIDVVIMRIATTCMHSDCIPNKITAVGRLLISDHSDCWSLYTHGGASIALESGNLMDVRKFGYDVGVWLYRLSG